MINPDLQTLQDRLEKLENKTRKMKNVATLVLVVAAAGWIGTHPFNKARVIGARQFVVKDVKGRVRATLGTIEGAVRLELYDGQGRPAVGAVGLSAGGGAIELHNEKGEVRVTMVAGVKGTNTALWLYDAKGRGRAGMKLSSDGSPILSLGDAHGKERLSLSVPASGSLQGPSVDLFDEHGKGRVALSVGVLDEAIRGPGLRLFDEEEKPGLVLLVNEIGPTKGPSLLMSSGGSRKRSILLAISDPSPDSPQMSILDKGEFVWQAP